MNIHIRNIPDATVATLDRLAANSGMSRNDFIVSLLTEAAGEREPIVLGFVKLDWYGDISPQDECDECHISYTDAGGVALGITSDNRHFITCAECAWSYSDHENLGS